MQFPIKFLQLPTLALIIFVTACFTSTNAQAKKKKAISKIDYVTMSFPKEIKWKQLQSREFEDGGMLAEWVVDGLNAQTSPVIISYNKVIQTNNADKLARKLVTPLASACMDSKITNLAAQSQYTNQANIEVICSRFGRLGFFGTVNYITVFSDKSATHIISSETKTIPSKKAGLLVPSNNIEKEQIDNSAAIIQLMNTFRESIRVCDSKQVCR